ncbi:MAG: hypothetical protein ACTHNP_00990 [Solirubrobacterales bacterium]
MLSLLALLVASALVPLAASAEAEPEKPQVSGSFAPEALPRAGAAPISLKLGFEVAAEEGVQSSIESIAIDISRRIVLRGKGLPSCPPLTLLSEYGAAECPKSLVGHGRVVSEIRERGGEPVIVNGKLRAYYSFAHKVPQILALVQTGPPMDLSYVIPFQIIRQKGTYRTRLFVHNMRHVYGICLGVGCYWGTYGLNGIYTRISDFELSLHRRFFAEGQRRSFVSAGCAVPGKQRGLSFPLARVTLGFDGVSQIAGQTGHCTAIG